MKSTVEKIEDAAVYIKKCFARSISWAYVPINILNMTMLLVTMLEVKKIGGLFSIAVPVAIGTSLLFFLLWMGHIDIKRKWYHKELKIDADNNPTLVEILEKVKKLEKR